MTNFPDEDRLTELAFAAWQQTAAAGVAIAIETDGVVICRARIGEKAPPLGARADTGIAGEALRSGSVQQCADTASDPRVNAEVCRLLGIRSIVMVPVRQDGRSVGVVSAFWDRPGGFSGDAVGALESIAAFLSRETQGPPEPASPQLEQIFSAEGRAGKSRLRRALPALTIAAALVLLAVALLFYRTRTEGYRAAEKAPEAHTPSPAAATPHPAATPPPSFADALHASAEAGNAEAQLSLANAYEHGDDGLEADPVQACAWFIVASVNGNRAADAPLRRLTARLTLTQIAGVRYELGQMYAAGRGIRPDREQAYMWFVLARQAGNPRAALGMDILRKFMSPEEVQAANQRATDWLARHRTKP